MAAENLLREHLRIQATMRMQMTSGIRRGKKGFVDCAPAGAIVGICGTSFTTPGEALTKDELKLLRAAVRRKRLPIKMCYGNSQYALLYDTSGALEYYEGFCSTGFFPFMHGWLVLNGKVIDLTLPADREKPRGLGLKNRILGKIPAHTEYLGVPCTKEESRAATIENEYFGPLLDDYGRGWPLLHNIKNRWGITEKALEEFQAPVLPMMTRMKTLQQEVG